MAVSWLRTSVAALAAVLVLGACGAESQERSSLERARSPETTTTTEAPTTTIAPAETTTTTAPAPEPAMLLLAAAPPAETAEELAQRIAAAEATVRDPASTAEVRAAAAFESQQLYRQLARTPEWEPAVLGTVPAHLHPTVNNNVAARREFRDMHSKLSDTLPAWRIVEPPPAEELLSYYRKGQEIFGVPWEILAAVNLVETGMGRIRGTSVAGAQGPMQFMPATWEAFGDGGDVNDPHDAIMGAARYLAHNGGGSGNIDGALWNYNHSNRYVRGVKHYAAIMAEDPQAFHGFYHWQVVYLSTAGDIWLPEGYEQHDRVAVTDYLAVNPAHHLGTATH